MGTVNTIMSADPGCLPYIKTVSDEISNLDSFISIFDPCSEISRLNAESGCGYVDLSVTSLELLNRSLRYSEMTDGLFDVTTHPLSALWRSYKKENRVPPPDEIEKSLMLVNYKDININYTARSAFLPKAGQAVDFGSIAKGWAADRAVSFLTGCGIKDAVINFGGTVSVFGPVRSVGIQNPFKTTGVPMGRIKIKDQSVVTSGSYMNYFIAEGKKYHHIIDPRTGYPSGNDLCSVTLVGNSAAAMDALTTAFFILGLKDGTELAESMDMDAIAVTDSGSVYMTRGIGNRFELL